jgi:transposase
MDAHGTMLGRQRLYRAQVMACIAPLPPRRIGLEACGGAHDWACHWRAHGHEVKLMAPPLGQPSVQASKNARRDAEALAEAVTRPTLRGGPTKRTSRTHSHKPLNLLLIFFIGYIDLKNN